MRIHTDTLTTLDIYEAARIARVEMEYTAHGSRKRDRAFNVNLTGESRRRPSRSHHSDEYAATWDQWGAFLAVLFDRDESLTIPSAYESGEKFDRATNYRFSPDGNDRADDSPYWPNDAHGDHRFRFNGTPGQQECTNCSAVQRWAF